MSDSLVAGPLVRPVRIGMLVNGAPVTGIKSFTVTDNNFFTCSKWQATVGLNGTNQGYGAPFWALQTGIEISLLASLTDGGALVPVIGGVVDKVEIDMASQNLTLAGRDYSAPLIDALTNEKFVNQKSSDVATMFAKRRGLTPQVTPTSIPIGRYLNSESGYVSEDISEFRLLAYLAQQEGFDFYTAGKNLVFAPAAQDPSPLLVTYRYADPSDPRVQANVPNITLTQDKTLAVNTTVQVRSWSYQNKAPVIATWQAQKTSDAPTGTKNLAKPSLHYTRAQLQGGVGAKGPFYIIRRSGLTQQQADQLAHKTLQDITSNERAVSVTCPGILGITARRTLRLKGTGTAFDQDYEIGDIHRAFGWDQGCSMTINAKSCSPQAEVSL